MNAGTVAPVVSEITKGRETSRKHESSNSPDGLNYHTSWAYTQEVKMNH